MADSQSKSASFTLVYRWAYNLCKRYRWRVCFVGFA